MSVFRFKASVALSLLSLSLTGGIASADEPAAKIHFTADNASHVYLNGVRIGETWDWQKGFEIDTARSDVELKSGVNVLAIAAWDGGQVAGINGKFEMADGTTFGTSDIEGWKVYNADINPDSCATNNGNAEANRTNTCTGLDFTEDFANEDEEFLKDAYKTKWGVYPDIPDNWNQIVLDETEGWEKPGSDGNNPSPWSNKSLDPTWLWSGARTGDIADNPWYLNNLSLFRFSFECKVEYCATEDQWEDELRVIEKDDDSPRRWDDIIDGVGNEATRPSAKTLPVFRGGTLSFEGFKGAEYSTDFYVDDFDGNTIDSKGNFIKFTGNFTGPGGLTFEGASKTDGEDDHPEIQLHGNVDYKGETIVATSGGVALVIQEESATPKGKVTIKDGAILRLRGDSINLDGDVILEENGKIGIHGEAARIKGKVELRGDGQSIVYVSEKLPRGQKNDNKEWTRPEINGVISGKGGLTKQGEGFLVLTRKNTYTGPTKINKGALYLGGNASLSPETTVAIKEDAEFTLNTNAEVANLTGEGKVKFDGDYVLTVGDKAEGDFEFEGKFIGNGGLTKKGDNVMTLTGINTYTGETAINKGTLSVKGSLSNATAVNVVEGGTYSVESTDEVGSIEGSGNIVISKDVILTAGSLGILDAETEFSGMISGDGGFTKVGEGTTIFSGNNAYAGETTIEDGVLSLASLTGIPRDSSTLVTGTGRLDLSSDQSVSGEFLIDQLSVREGGIVFVSPSQPLVANSITLAANPQDDSNPGGFVAFLDEKNNPPIRINKNKNASFVYESGSLIIAAPDDDDPEGVWEVIEGKVENPEKLAENTFIQISGRNEGYLFKGLGEEKAVEAVLYSGYLEEGSLNLVIEEKTTGEISCDLYPSADECKEEKPDKPVPLPICDNDDCSPVGPEEKPEPDSDGDGEIDDLDKDDDNDGISDNKDPDDDGDGEIDQLPGCEVGDDLCDIISDIEGDEDDALEEEEEAAGDIIEGVIDGLEDEEIDLPFGFDYGQLARLVASGLAPRNVDAAGRGLALHNNLLVDAVFERQPLRQFEELLVSEEVVEESVAGEEAVIEDAAPVQPLWLKSEELSDGEAAEYVEGAVAQADVEAADAEALILVDLNDDELDLAKRDGVSAWVKGFGGNSRADESSILYNDYDLNAYGTSFGVDVALSKTFQIGAYANYGDLNVNHRSGDTGGGSWNPEGWGGGLTAQYSTRHFYVQGLLGASEFSGEQSRNILRINEDLGGNTARGDKSVTSYLGALRIGAPFKTGGVVLEPQGQVVWTRNHEQGFSETRGTEKNLRLKYKSRTTNFAETELGMKLSVPIRTGERVLLVPSLRAAWLADWNQANEGQEIGYKFTNKTVNFESQLGTENGALIEAGLDYTVQNFNGISVKLYGRGGMEFWASDRGTTWRASGGVTFQF